MSVQVNHNVVHGLMMSYKTARVELGTALGITQNEIYEALEPYEDSAYEGIKHHDGLCVIADGMNGKYFFVGRVLAKSDVHEGFDEPIEIPSLDTAGDDVLKALIKEKLGLVGEIKSYVFSHYR